MRLGIVLELTEEELRVLAYGSSRLRDEPRKAWSTAEYKEHARYCIEQLVKRHMESKKW